MKLCMYRARAMIGLLQWFW